MMTTGGRIRTGLTTAAIAALAACIAPPLTGCGSQRQRSLAEERAERLDRARDFAERGVRAHSRGDYDAALEFYYRSIALYDDIALVRNNLGLLLLEQGNYLDAVFQFRTAADLEPGDPRPQANIGVAYSQAGYPGDALRHFDLALRADGSYLPALRGAVQAASDISRATDEDLERIKLALLMERDPEWRTFFQRERFRIENRLRIDRTRPAAEEAFHELDDLGGPRAPERVLGTEPDPRRDTSDIVRPDVIGEPDRPADDGFIRPPGPDAPPVPDGVFIEDNDE